MSLLTALNASKTDEICKKNRVITDTTARGIGVNKEKLARYLFDKTTSVKPE